MSRACFVRVTQLRQKSKYAVVENIEELLSSGNLKHRAHPGISNPRSPNPPPWLYGAIQGIIKKKCFSQKVIRKEAEALVASLYHRQVPLEEEELQQKLKLVKCKFKKTETMDEEEFRRSKYHAQILRQIVNYWQPIDYKTMTSFLYLVGRGMQDYTVLYKIFNEIRQREPNFKPYTLLDFGSGVGTVSWAASEFWKDSLREHVCIDVSEHMHDLAETIIKDANLDVRGTFYRQHLPSATPPTFDIVTSAYSLLELPDLKTRLNTLANLWEKTNFYLVLVENGRNAGYRVLNEARDFILNYANNDSQSQSQGVAHVFAPCPHDLACPRSGDGTPCNFEAIYHPLPFFKPKATKRELYSYVVLKKGARPADDEKWPRIVRETLKRSRHVICRMCINSGELREEIFTTWKSGKNTYRCARCSAWGDRLPVKLVKEETKDRIDGDQTTHRPNSDSDSDFDSETVEPPKTSSNSSDRSQADQ